MPSSLRPLAIVTGASSGIGLELARLCARDGHDLLIAADQNLDAAAADLRAEGTSVETVECDLGTDSGVDQLVRALDGRPLELLLANAGHGLGHAFLDQDFDDVRHVIDTNITGTLYLIRQIGRSMRDRRQGRILITSSTAGFVPGSFHAVYNGTMAFIASFSAALRNELKDSGVTVTCLIPGATDTGFFERADMLDTKVGQKSKDDPADVAQAGYEAMKNGDGDVVSGWMNKALMALAAVTPSAVLAEQHRKMAEPGSAQR